MLEGQISQRPFERASLGEEPPAREGEGEEGRKRRSAAPSSLPSPGQRGPGGGVHGKAAAEPMRRKGPSMWGGCLHQPGPGSFNPAGGEARGTAPGRRE